LKSLRIDQSDQFDELGVFMNVLSSNSDYTLLGYLPSNFAPNMPSHCLQTPQNF
jgi:hypothetical protein